MKADKLPKSAWSGSQAAGSQSQQLKQSSSYNERGYDEHNVGMQQHDPVSHASNDASYHRDHLSHDSLQHLAKQSAKQDCYLGYRSNKSSSNKKSCDQKKSSMIDTHRANSYEESPKLDKDEPLMAARFDDKKNNISNDTSNRAKGKNKAKSNQITTDNLNNSDTLLGRLGSKNVSNKDIPERVFMNGLIKHTGIALAIIIPLAAFSAYAATPPVNAGSMAATNASMDKMTTETLSIEPSAIIHKSANTPTTVDSVDLEKYAGTWYEIGRLPMYFQRKCAGDVTANYAQKADGKGITVTNKCMAEDGSEIIAEGLAKTADDTGSKLKVTFLPSWIRWLPVGRADYWVLARDADYKTALVGTPDKDYLWLLARSPNVSQETYSKYRQIAQQQGYDLKEFKLTPQTNQTVNLTP